jgi:predicted Zn-dependent protease
MNPDDADARRLMGDVQVRMRRHADALDSYAAAEALTGDSWELAVGRAHALRALGRNEDALLALVQARAWERAHTIGEFSWRMRAEVLLDLGRPQEAVAELRELLASDLVTKSPTRNFRSVPLCVLARALEGAGELEQAVRACTEARSRPPRETTPCECRTQ